MDIKLLAVATLSLGIYQIAGAWGGWRQYEVLSHLPLNVTPAYMIASRAFWGIVFTTLAVGVWQVRQWGRRGLLVAGSIYAIHYWLERLWMGGSDYIRLTTPCAAAAWGAGAAIATVILLRRRDR